LPSGRASNRGRETEIWWERDEESHESLLSCLGWCVEKFVTRSRGVEEPTTVLGQHLDCDTSEVEVLAETIFAFAIYKYIDVVVIYHINDRYRLLKSFFIIYDEILFGNFGGLDQSEIERRRLNKKWQWLCSRCHDEGRTVESWHRTPHGGPSTQQGGLLGKITESYFGHQGYHS